RGRSRGRAERGRARGRRRARAHRGRGGAPRRAHGGVRGGRRRRGARAREAHPATRRRDPGEGLELAEALGSRRRARPASGGLVAILSLGVLLAAFLLGFVLGAPYIRLLRRLRMGKRVRREGPASHLITKQGMVTMGGVLFIFVTFVLWLIVLILLPPEQRDDYLPQTIVPIGTLLAVGVLGFIDDYVNVLYGFGIRGRHKLVWQTIVALAAALFVALAVFAIVAMSNGMNLTDGLDGLAGGTAVFAFLSFAFVAAARGY